MHRPGGTASANGEKWHLDEVFLNINGVRHYLWQAVDQNGVVIDILVQPKPDRFAAMRFFRKLLQATGCRPRVIVTDKLQLCRRQTGRNAPCRSPPAPVYNATCDVLALGVEHTLPIVRGLCKRVAD